MSEEGAGRERCDLLVRHGCVVTMDAERRVHADGAVAVRGTDVVAAGPDRELAARFEAAETVDAAGGVVHPGFIDAHNHIVHGTCRGVFANTERSGDATVNFADWKADVTADDERIATALAALELLHNGFTGFVEAGTAFERDAIAAAAVEVGVRVALAEPYLWDDVEVMRHLPSLGRPSLFRRVPADRERALAALGSELHRNADAGGHVHGFVCIYGLGTASDELQRAAKAVADENGVVLHQHECYVPATTGWSRERHGRSPIAHLAGLGVLDRRSTLVHVNVLDEGDGEILAATGVNVVWCPVAWFNLGLAGVAPCRMPELAAGGVHVSLATDGARDCVVGDAALAAHLAARSAGATLDPGAIVEMQTIAAARAAGLDHLTGSIEPGKRADLVVRSASAPAAWPGVNPVHQLALTSRANTADTVLVNGEVVLRGGASTRVDEVEVGRAARDSVHARMQRLGLSAPV